MNMGDDIWHDSVDIFQLFSHLSNSTHWKSFDNRSVNLVGMYLSVHRSVQSILGTIVDSDCNVELVITVPFSAILIIS